MGHFPIDFPIKTLHLHGKSAIHRVFSIAILTEPEGQNRKTTIFHGNTHCKPPFSTARLNYHRVDINLSWKEM